MVPLGILNTVLGLLNIVPLGTLPLLNTLLLQAQLLIDQGNSPQQVFAILSVAITGSCSLPVRAGEK
ncbi:hypothetical protein RHABOEDO_001883 (plasmid) [Candidatus Rhabdochlamydia oedothoracis]|uniref:Uncharacterized protein n=1 Tax=Candidatus Rhabdochlamydia oedothoracis TaxID=2720720 RepID=A0ABX8V3P4_9BACT|nr:hypothetical protein RHOW815_001400 [Candidatus Rhabdochlamydia sp. W815]QYF49486.1 hypothetical protein RHABOEDO_001883 [Candidatus Rhabdochlamydia oedothoracis]